MASIRRFHANDPFLQLLKESGNYRFSDARSSHQRCSIKKVFLKIHNIHRKTPVLEPYFNNNFTKIHVFSCKYWEIFKNTYFEEHLRTAASVALSEGMKVDWLSHCKVTQKKQCPCSISKEPSDAVARRCFSKQVFLKICNFHRKTPVLESFSLKLQS